MKSIVPFKPQETVTPHVVVIPWGQSWELSIPQGFARKWQPTPVFLPGESQGRGRLVGCRLWGHTESGRLKQLSSPTRSNIWVIQTIAGVAMDPPQIKVVGESLEPALGASGPDPPP